MLSSERGPHSAPVGVAARARQALLQHQPAALLPITTPQSIQLGSDGPEPLDTAHVVSLRKFADAGCDP